MLRFHRFLAGTIVLALAACSPQRGGFLDSEPEDVTAVDNTPPPDVNAVDAADVRDVRDVQDVVDVVDAMVCDDEVCDRNCRAEGWTVGGVCTSRGVCRCFGELRDGGMDAPRDMVDVPVESSVITCMSNAECPPTTFCNGPSCMGPGFCSPRNETDAAVCGTEGPVSCGCNGVLYPNTCARLANGVRLDSRGCADARRTDSSAP